ncbi:protein kinase family protein [Parashewanella spongiae]|uniref:Protein kinase family protein n=2 Tax=Parashewanella spongiae TaxID=342950 RepID=A0A3A6U3G6_9GAMM|nr:protein kinase family protein [Parashewanella spongiae]RJY18591.1 protein kinase family protein [Parashewanella spongiae]
MQPLITSEASPTYQSLQKATKFTWTIGGTEYECDKKALEKSGLRERYTDFHYIDRGWYAYIYRATDKKELSHWALKVVEKEKWQRRFKQDINNFHLTKGEKAIIQSLEHHDLGPTGVLVIEFADGDMSYRDTPFKKIKTERTFRILARQLLEGVETLDRLGLYHDTLGLFDFLYVNDAGRVKLSGLERAVKNHRLNKEALKVVYSALKPFSRSFKLSDASNDLLSTLEGGKSVAADLLKHEIFTTLPVDLPLEL